MAVVLPFNALEADEQHAFAERLHAFMRTGNPVPPFDANVMAEARDWAAWASNVELRAYAAACLERMAPRERSRCIAWATQMKPREAAA